MRSILDRTISHPEQLAAPKLERALLAATALLLPYVIFEPAPADVAIVLLLVVAAIGRGYRLTLLPFLGALVYIFSTGVAAVAGTSSTYFDPEIYARYFLIEAFLLPAVVASCCYFRDRQGSSEYFMKYYVYGALISSVLVIGLQVSHFRSDLIYAGVGNPRIKGFFKDPNVLSPFLIFPIVLLLFGRDRGFRNPLWLLCVPVIGYVLYTAYSRGGYGAAGIAMGLAMAARFLREWSIKPIIYFVVALAAAALLLTVAQSLDLITLDVDFFRRRLSYQQYDDGRFALNNYALSELSRHLFGLGPSIFGAEYHVNPHNLFLGKATDAGFLAAFVVCGFIIIATWRAWSDYFRSGNSWSLALGATLVAHLVESNVIYSHHWRHMLFLAAMGAARNTAKSPGRCLEPPIATTQSVQSWT